MSVGQTIRRPRRMLELAAALTVVCACARDPRPVPCPDVAAGELVVTELRGPQSGEDAYGEWIELYNGSGANIDLLGGVVQMTKLDGSTTGKIVIRDPDLAVEPGGYVVLGRVPAGGEPDHVDYGYIDDFDRSLFEGAAIDVVSCGELIDRAIYRDIPNTGTLAVDGALDPPTAEANDDESSWCVDDTADAMSETDGIRGTPRERNRECVE